MKIYKKICLVTCLLLVAAAFILGTGRLVRAEPGAVYELASSVVGSDGTAVAGGYQTDVVIGQTATAHHAVEPYELDSGFWGGGLVTKGTALLRVFLPLIQH
jgi:hypothetical protein